jgi:hypothetical protein
MRFSEMKFWNGCHELIEKKEAEEWKAVKGKK